MGISTNSKNQDEMHCLLGQNRSSEKEIYYLEIITCGPSKYTMDHPDLIVSNFMENPSVYKGLRVNTVTTSLYLLECTDKPSYVGEYMVKQQMEWC